MSNPSPVPFELVHISTEEYATFEDKYTEQVEGVGIAWRYAIDEENYLICCELRFDLGEQEDPFLVITMVGEFEFNSEFWAKQYDTKKTKFTLKKELARHLAVIVTGICRGVIHEKTEGTNLNGTILPQINLVEIIGESIVFELN